MAACCCLVILVACTDNSLKNEPQPFAGERGANIDPNERAQQSQPGLAKRDNSIEAQRLAYIRKMFRTYPKMRFPFRNKAQGDDHVRRMEASDEADTMLYGDYVPVYIVGTIADTSNYFGVFYMIPADDIILSLVTIDKSGRIIERQMLVESCWQGGESDCETHTEITKDMLIRYDYSEFLFPGDDENGYDSIPDEARGYTRVSKITSSGRIKQLKRTEKDPAILLQHPILH